jgi:hypothetical protein
MPLEPAATSFSLANAQILAQASAVAHDSAERCEAWATTTEHYLVTLKTSLPV